MIHNNRPSERVSPTEESSCHVGGREGREGEERSKRVR